jgi:hypothetical protein
MQVGTDAQWLNKFCDNKILMKTKLKNKWLEIQIYSLYSSKNVKSSKFLILE